MIICIAGPSGIGKTRLSIALAKKIDAIIINADATQIYKDLNIGSAKIKEEEKEGIKHFLFDIKSPDENYSVSDYQIDARKIIENNKDKNIIVVGGTGLYIRALFYNYEFSEINDYNYDSYSNEELLKMAKQLNPNINIHPNNRVRIENFLKKDGVNVTSNKLLYDVVFIGLTMDRDKLYNIINNRVDKMIENGLEEEVSKLYIKYPNSNILKRAIGYKELIEYFNGNITKEDAIDLIKKNSRHYVKRQYTWFNNKLNINWFNIKDDYLSAEDEIISFISSLNSK